MNIEAVCSIIMAVVVAYLIWYLHRSGKQIQRRQRELEERDRMQATSSKSTGLEK